MLKTNSITSTLILATLLLFAVPRLANAQQASNKAPVFYCNDGAFTKEDNAVLKVVIPEIYASKRTVRELPNGYELRFTDGAKMYPIAAEYFARLIKCCPFFEVSASVSGSGGPATVRLTGAKGVKEFILSDHQISRVLTLYSPAK